MDEGVNDTSSAGGRGPVLVCGDTHAGQAFVGDLVRTCRSRSQYPHIRVVHGVSTLVSGYEQIIIARMYPTCFCVVMGCGLVVDY